MKTLIVLSLLLVGYGSHAQNIFKDIKARNQAHQRQVEQNEKMEKLTEDIQNKAHNPGTTLAKAGDLLLTGLIVQTTTTGIGTIMLSGPKPTEAGKYIIVGGAVVGLGLQVMGFSKIIRAGRQFEVRIGGQ